MNNNFGGLKMTKSRSTGREGINSSSRAIVEDANSHFPSTNTLEKTDTDYSLLRLLRWSKISLVKLVEAERKLLSKVSSHILPRFVTVRLGNSSVYTVTVKPTANSEENPVPFVLIHGFGAGLAIWAGNFDSLAEKRTVHAFDILGFARSGRPDFTNDATLAELEFVQSIEDWRKEMKVEKMILVGHSFGGFLASSYSLEYPERVRHLVLVDPWGFPDKPVLEQPHIPVWMRMFGSMLSLFNPLASLRAAGPFGVSLIKKLRSDLAVRYAFEDSEAIYDYIYQCNAASPTGEMAFVAMTKSFGWAKRPMVHRFNGLDPKLPVTFICGSKSWIDSSIIYEIQSRRSDSYVDVQVITGAGHHVYADASDAFNAIMRSISDVVHAGDDLQAGSSQQASSSTASGRARPGRLRSASILLAEAVADEKSTVVEAGADCSRGVACVSSVLSSSSSSFSSSSSSSITVAGLN